MWDTTCVAAAKRSPTVCAPHLWAVVVAKSLQLPQAALNCPALGWVRLRGIVHIHTCRIVAIAASRRPIAAAAAAGSSGLVQHDHASWVAADDVVHKCNRQQGTCTQTHQHTAVRLQKQHSTRSKRAPEFCTVPATSHNCSHSQPRTHTHPMHVCKLGPVPLHQHAATVSSRRCRGNYDTATADSLSTTSRFSLDRCCKISPPWCRSFPPICSAVSVCILFLGAEGPKRLMWCCVPPKCLVSLDIHTNHISLYGPLPVQPYSAYWN